ncbi:MAG: glycoside hydrolase family 43 protein [Bacteroidota bacterium]
MKKHFPLLCLLWLASVIVGCRTNTATPTAVPPTPVVSTTTFTNPLMNSGADPWVIKKDGVYYYCHTLGDKIGLWKTTAMSQLGKATSKVVWLPPTTGGNSHNLWAPELHFIDGKWYIYYTAGSSPDLGTQRTWVLENASADPLTGTWTDKGQIFLPTANYWAIDGTILQLNNANYFIWSGYVKPSDITQRIYIAKMSNPWTLADKRAQLSYPQYSWETIGDPQPDVNEGPEILKKNGKVFLVYSASGCWTDDYALGMLTMSDSSDPMDSTAWKKSSLPVFSKSSGAYGPGHNGFFQSPDGTEDWIIYHANPQAGQGCGGARSPRIQKFAWNADGTPNFGQPIATSIPIAKPSGE